MSRRESFYSIVRRPCDGGESPNNYVPEITAEVRVFAPPNVGSTEMLEALAKAFFEVVDQIVPGPDVSPRSMPPTPAPPLPQ